MAEKEVTLPAELLDRLATFPSVPDESSVLGLMKAAYAAGQAAKIDATQKRAISTAVEEAVMDECEQLWGVLADPVEQREIGRLLDADPAAPRLSEQPYDRAAQLGAICRAVTQVLDVTP